jgi:hypothetical protein
MLSTSRSAKAGIAGLVAASLLCCTLAPAGATTTTTTTLPSAGTAAPAVKNLLNNGNFALPVGPFNTEGYRPAGYYTVTHTKAQSIPGWVVGATTDPDLQNSAGPPDYQGGVQVYSRGYITPPPGTNQEVMMDWAGPGNLSQAVATISGLTYELSWFGAGYSGIATSKSINVMWDGKLVDTPTFVYSYKTISDPTWQQYHTVVTAGSASSLLEFVYDPVCAGGAASLACSQTQYGPMIAEVTLNGDVKLYLPPSITLAPAGPLLAVVRGANGQAFSDPSLVVTLVGTWESKVVSYAPPVSVTRQLAVASVVDSVATLHLVGIPASMVGHTVTATATLAGPGFATVSQVVKIRVS